MRLEELVPPLNLCKKIPAGEFEDSAFCWHYTDVAGFVCRTSGCEQVQGKAWQIVHNHPRKIEIRRKHGEEIYPAPTLHEILAALPPYGKNEQILACCVPDWADFDARVFGEHWRVGYTGDCSINDKNPATAALELWLKHKGIEE